MSKAPKVIKAETVADAEPAPEVAAAEPESTLPTGDPLSWTVEEWLKAADFPLDKVRADLAAQAARGGAAGVPFAFALSLVQNHANPAVLARAFALVAQGLVEVATTGKGPHGHAGVELA